MTHVEGLLAVILIAVGAGAVVLAFDSRGGNFRRRASSWLRDLCGLSAGVFVIAGMCLIPVSLLSAFSAFAFVIPCIIGFNIFDDVELSESDSLEVTFQPTRCPEWSRESLDTSGRQTTGDST